MTAVILNFKFPANFNRVKLENDVSNDVPTLIPLLFLGLALTKRELNTIKVMNFAIRNPNNLHAQRNSENASIEIKLN